MTVERSRSGEIRSIECPKCHRAVAVTDGVMFQHSPVYGMDWCVLSGAFVFDRVAVPGVTAEVPHMHGSLSKDLAAVRGFKLNDGIVFGSSEHPRRAAGWLWEQWRLAGYPSLPGLRMYPYERQNASVRALIRGQSAQWGTLQQGNWLGAKVSWCVETSCRPSDRVPDRNHAED